MTGVSNCPLKIDNAMLKSWVLVASNKTGNEGHTAQNIADSVTGQTASEM